MSCLSWSSCSRWKKDTGASLNEFVWEIAFENKKLAFIRKKSNKILNKNIWYVYQKNIKMSSSNSSKGTVKAYLKICKKTKENTNDEILIF